MLQHFRNAEISDPYQSSDVWLPRADQVRVHGVGFSSLVWICRQTGQAKLVSIYVMCHCPLPAKALYNTTAASRIGQENILAWASLGFRIRPNGTQHIGVSRLAYAWREKVCRPTCESLSAIVAQYVCITTK